MKKIKLILATGIGLFFITTLGLAQKMTWTTKSSVAKDLVMKAANHYMNIEVPQAYDELTEALRIDPNFTVGLVYMSIVTVGDIAKGYAVKAVKSAAGKTEGERLFANLVDRSDTAVKFKEKILRMHQMFPDDMMISNFYVSSLGLSSDQFYNALQEHLKKFPQDASAYNFLGYYYMNQAKDNEKAKEAFEKYIQLHPDGPNPYDSMGEFYLNTGDIANAKKYYNLALEKYPFFTSSLNAIEKMKQPKAEVKNN